MKFKQSIIAIGMALLMLTPTIGYATENVSISKNATIGERISTDDAFFKEEQESLSKYGSDFLAKQEDACLNYEKLMNSFDTDKSTRATSSVYPDYFGGSYIDDSGNLVIYVKDADGSKADGSKNITRALDSKSFIVKKAKYTYNELNSLMNTLNDFKLKNPKDAIANNYNIFWLSDKDNNIVVELNDISKKQIDLFKKRVTDSPVITFVASSGTPMKQVKVNPGQEISKSQWSASMGYRAKKDGVVGIVTAGHFAPLNATIDINGTIIGKVTASKMSGSVDAGFVKITNSSYVPTNTLNGTSKTLSTTISKPGVGTIINKLGYVTGTTSGRVLSTNVTITLDGTLHTNLTSADYYSDYGDSGGIVYSYISSTNKRYTLGIHCAQVGSRRYFIKASEINSALGISRY